MARRTYKLDHATKGTGANVVPIDGEDKKPAAEEPRKLRTTPLPREERPRPAGEPKQTFLTPLPPGHVRKKSTGELGKVKALDPKAGTVTVAWLKAGMTSTVPLASVTRR